MIDYDDDGGPLDWQVRNDLWAKYYKADTNDWGIPMKESPLRGVDVCYRCGVLVDDTWKHLDWHTKLEGEDWER